jgi:hypothetical protein
LLKDIREIMQDRRFDRCDSFKLAQNQIKHVSPKTFPHICLSRVSY